ncbi:MAG: hypothetical protein A2Y33_06735 [Spirochaetes bacterium GWF1_51_8]|nr:MAG: hypothetical protein A2Y33_06735 [Spirochaetes bacterium GWF1_51_8]
MNVIEVRNVSKSYPEIKAVNGLSFNVEESTCFGLLGPNGAGKTTMMKMIYGKARRDSDCDCGISIFGFDPLHHELEIKSICGVVPQENNLDAELNVWDNLYVFSKFYGIPSKIAKKRIDELLDFMELSERKKSKIDELSGGMKRRLTIARALINQPKLLILDEPTTGLDPQVRHLIWEKLRGLMKSGVTILITTHYMEEAFQICDSIIIMDKGAKMLEGKPAELLSSHVESYVLEVINPEASAKIKSEALDHDARMDDTLSVVFYYSNDLGLLKRLSEKLAPGDYMMRQSNLEDLFLKTTGRQLNDEQ